MMNHKQGVNEIQAYREKQKRHFMLRNEKHRKLRGRTPELTGALRPSKIKDLLIGRPVQRLLGASLLEAPPLLTALLIGNYHHNKGIYHHVLDVSYTELPFIRK